MLQKKSEQIWSKVLEIIPHGYTVEFYEGANGEVGVIIEGHHTVSNMGVREFLAWELPA